MIRWALLAACLRPFRAEFMVLDPAEYRDHYTEGWPGPHDDGSGVGGVNQSTCKTPTFGPWNLLRNRPTDDGEAAGAGTGPTSTAGPRSIWARTTPPMASTEPTRSQRRHDGRQCTATPAIHHVHPPGSLEVWRSDCSCLLVVWQSSGNDRPGQGMAGCYTDDGLALFL